MLELSFCLFSYSFCISSLKIVDLKSETILLKAVLQFYNSFGNEQKNDCFERIVIAVCAILQHGKLKKDGS